MSHRERDRDSCRRGRRQTGVVALQMCSCSGPPIVRERLLLLAQRQFWRVNGLAGLNQKNWHPSGARAPAAPLLKAGVDDACRSIYRRIGIRNRSWRASKVNITFSVDKYVGVGYAD